MRRVCLSVQSDAKRAMTVVSLAVAFGVAIAVLKGGSAGVRDSLGNVSAPWLLLPYFAGGVCRGWSRGAVMGAAACLGAVASFYVTEAFVLDLGEHSMLTDLRLTLGSGRVYFEAAAICGPLFGAIGGSRTRRRGLITAAVVGLALVGEPLVVFAWQGSNGVAAGDSGMVTGYAPLWIGEMVLGAVLAAWILLRSGRSGAAPAESAV